MACPWVTKTTSASSGSAARRVPSIHAATAAKRDAVLFELSKPPVHQGESIDKAVARLSRLPASAPGKSAASPWSSGRAQGNRRTMSLPDRPMGSHVNAFSRFTASSRWPARRSRSSSSKRRKSGPLTRPAASMMAGNTAAFWVGTAWTSRPISASAVCSVRKNGDTKTCSLPARAFASSSGAQASAISLACSSPRLLRAESAPASAPGGASRSALLMSPGAISPRLARSTTASMCALATEWPWRIMAKRTMSGGNAKATQQS
mmetsp:Transcript_23265/g.73653  ORF Transcript_23265/g.73653 Transcript_23265/m.73653 type:complete len:263 (+) Transcript_23265:333-1121(+)